MTLSGIEIHGYWFLYIPEQQSREGTVFFFCLSFFSFSLYKLIKSKEKDSVVCPPFKADENQFELLDSARRLYVNWLPFISHGSLRARHPITQKRGEKTTRKNIYIKANGHLTAMIYDRTDNSARTVHHITNPVLFFFVCVCCYLAFCLII